MSQAMQAAVLTGPQTFELRDVEVPDVGPDRVRVRVRNCGVCGSDLHFYRGEFPSPPGLRMGHEFAGEVAEVGPGVDDLSTGQRVAVEPV